jgi:hypothetical protein
MQAFKDMGYEPVIFGEADISETKNEIYSYVESGIPPVVLLALHDGNFHAVTALGHYHKRPISYAEQIIIKRKSKKIFRYYRSSEWVPNFFIHDDQRGFYREMEFLDLNPHTLKNRITINQRNAGLSASIKGNLLNWHCPVSIKTNSSLSNVPKETIANIWGVIVPIPKGVTLTHSEAENKAIKIIERCMSSKNIKIPNELVIRSYLMLSNNYKVLLGNRDDMNGFVRAFYQGKPMPKWIWIFELTTATFMNRKRLSDIKIKGEFILDASSNPEASDFLAFHWVDSKRKGLLTTMSQDDFKFEESLNNWWNGSDEPYHPMIRNLNST